MTMNHFLLFAAAGFLPVLTRKVTMVTYNSILTESSNVQDEIVNLHNTIRRKVDPTARNMLKMSWNEEAAQNARLLSKDCDPVKSNPLKRRITNTFCGENKHLTSYVISWSDVIEIWYNESKYFHYGYLSSMDYKETDDHYTQMIWATSYLIGCGVSSCCTASSPAYLYICHYCHEGNEPDRKNKPFRMGKPCEACPNNCENGLCTNPCIYYDEYTNCETLKDKLGCNHESVKLLCKASCHCNTEIK